MSDSKNEDSSASGRTGSNTVTRRRAKLLELGWGDPPPVPDYPGETIEWRVAEVERATCHVAQQPGNPDAWIAAIVD